MPALPQGIQKQRYGEAALTPDEASRRLYGERMLINDKTRLTWNPDRPPMVPDDRKVGDVNLNLPYMFLQKVIFYQNCRFFLSNGEPTSLGYISQNYPHLYNDCVRAKELMDRDAARRDPLLCKHCFEYRALDPDDYHGHIIRFHTDEVLSSLKADEAIPAPPAAADDSLHGSASALPASFKCQECGRSCKTRMALGSHRRIHRKSEAS